MEHGHSISTTRRRMKLILVDLAQSLLKTIILHTWLLKKRVMKMKLQVDDSEEDEASSSDSEEDEEESLESLKENNKVMFLSLKKISKALLSLQAKYDIVVAEQNVPKCDESILNTVVDERDTIQARCNNLSCRE